MRRITIGRGALVGRGAVTRRAALARLAGVLAVTAVAAIAVALLARQETAAQNPPGWQPGGPPGWHVGDPIRQPLPQPSAAAAITADRASRMAGGLGLAGHVAHTRHERDTRSNQVVDEITFEDLSGTMTAEMTLDAATGAPVMVARLDRPSGSQTARVNAVGAPQVASGYLRALGLAQPASSPRALWDPGLETWKVGWERSIDGIPAPGDGTFVDVLPGGQFAGLAVVYTPVASAPEQRVAPSQASDAAMAWATARGLPAMQAFRVEAPVLQWQQANDFVDSTKPDAPEPLLRLVYSVKFSFVPQGEESPKLVVLYVDASNATLIGGAETA